MSKECECEEARKSGPTQQEKKESELKKTSSNDIALSRKKASVNKITQSGMWGVNKTPHRVPMDHNRWPASLK